MDKYIDNYIKGKGVFVGTFTEQDLISGTDKIKVAETKQKTGLKYTNQEINLEKKTMKIYVCAMEDFR